MQIREEINRQFGCLTITDDGTITQFDANVPAILPVDEMKVKQSNWFDIVPWTTISIVKFREALTTLIHNPKNTINIILSYKNEGRLCHIETICMYSEMQVSRLIEISVRDITHHSVLDDSYVENLRTHFVKELGGIGTADVFLTWDEQLDIISYPDKTMRNIIGLEEDKIPLQDMMLRIPEFYHPILFEKAHSLIDGNSSFDTIHTYKHPTNGLIWIELHGKVMKRSDSQIRAMLLVRDITKDISKLDELALTKKHLEKSVQLAKIGYFEVDFLTGEVLWDDTCYAIHGYQRGEVITYNRFIEEILYPKDKEHLIEEFTQKLQTKNALTMEYKGVTQTGEIKWIREIIEPIFNEVGETISICGAKMDITKERESELKLTQYREQLERKNRNLENLIVHDALTKIYNRRMFDERFEYEWRRAVRQHTPLTVAIADIDHFKEYNDLYGHIEGDKCLIKVSQKLENCLTRSTDMVARYGGEEFAFILPDTSEPQILLEKCRNALLDLAIPHRNNGYSIVSISIGGATQIPTKELSKTELLDKADEMLYKAKKEGRNRVYHYNFHKPNP